MIGIDVIGFISANFGLSVAARNTVRLLTGKGYPVAVVDIPLGDDRSGRDHSYDHLVLPENAPHPHGVRLFHLNPPALGRILEKKPAWSGSASDLNVALPFWELPHLPGFWAKDLQAMDVVLCPSRFIEQAIANTVLDPAPKVRYYPQTVFLPKAHRPDRVRFGLPENGVCYVLSFDMAGDTERKNPWGAIDAFNLAFSAGENARLVIKLSTTYLTPALQQQLDRLRNYAAANDRIVIVDKSMSYEEVVSFYESCDVFVSLHRSEGLGLGLMEAMFLGKPVIATAWSGNMDFMNDLNSCLTSYRFIPVLSPVYRGLMRNEPVQWADPSIEEAAWWMRRLYEEPALRAAKGAAARHDMLRRHDECLKGDAFAMIEELYRLKKSRVEAAGPSSPGAAVGNAQPISDPGKLFSAVSELIKRNSIHAAMALYDRSRGLLPLTPELLRFDEVMRQLREKAKAGGG
jgi:glycosyltransferase involved in cell wall biosynthesis